MDRPEIVVLVAASLDGRTALGPNRTQWEEMADPRNEGPYGGSGAWARVVRQIEEIHNPGAEMQGSASFVKQTDELTPLPPWDRDRESLYHDFLPEEVLDRPGHQKWLVVVDGRGRMRSGYTGDESTGSHMLHLVSYAVPAAYLAFLQRKRIPYLIAGDRRVDLPAVIERLKTQLNVECLLSMAGGKLNGALLRAGLVDEVNILFTPRLIGGFDTPSLFDSPDLENGEWPTPLELLSVQVQAEGVLWVRYTVVS